MSQHGFPERLSGKSKPLDEDVVCQGQGTMEILVESLTGSAFQMTVSPHDTIYAIKSKIFRVEGIPMSHQHLLYNLKELEDSCSLSDYSIKDGSTLRLVLSIRGGPISTRRLPLPAVEDLQWRDIKDFMENNRDEAVDWLPPGCKVLVFKDGDNVNLLKVIEDDDDDHYTTLSDYSFSDETAVTMCKMIDLRSKMEKLSMKRNKKKLSSRSKLWMNRVENAPPPAIKRTTSEENISSTFKGVFDETPNFTKYKYGKMSSNRASDDNISNYCSIFQVEPHSSRMSSKNDKFGLWQPISSLSEVSSNDSASSKTWQACTSRGFHSRESSTSDFFKTKSDCSSSTESFKDSILAGTFGNGSVKHEPQDVDTYGDGGTSDKGFLREDGELLASDVMSQSNANQCNPNVGGSGPGGVVLETTTAPTPALPLPLIAHSPNTGSNYGDFSVAQLLGNDPSASTSSQFDDRNQYYYNAGPATTHLKRNLRKMMFRSNSHLNSTPEPVPGPSHILGSEPHLDQLDDLTEERIPSKSTTLSSSISNLYVNPRGSAKLSVPTVDRTWSSELDKAESTKFKRASAVRPGNMVFSSSTSDLLGLKRHKILPSLSRHPNCERLDVSDDSLHNMEILKNDALPTFKAAGDTPVNNAIPPSGIESNVKKSNPHGAVVSWSNPGFSTNTLSTSPFADNRTRPPQHYPETSSRNNSIHNIRYIQNGNSSDDLTNNSSSISSLPFQYGVPGSSRRNLEVGSERRCRRIKKILKLDHNNIPESKSRFEVLSRQLGFRGQGYEASIQKMPNNCQITPVRNEGQFFSRESIFSPLYERFLQVRTNPNRDSQLTLHEDEDDTSKLLDGLKDLNTSVENIQDTKPHETGRQQPQDVHRDNNSSQLIKKPKRMRCAFCKKRLSVASIHTCRCGVVFCAPHRYAEVHGCQYDYKAEGQEYLRRANPLVSAPKLPKI